MIQRRAAGEPDASPGSEPGASPGSEPGASPYSSPTTASPGLTRASRPLSACSTAVSASLTGVMSGLVSTARSPIPKRASVIWSATSVSSSASARSSEAAVTASILVWEQRHVIGVLWTDGSEGYAQRRMTANDLQRATTEVLQRLVRFNTVNPPGNERPAIEYLARYLWDAGFETELLGATEERPNLIADLRGSGEGPTLCYIGHVDTVLADASEWSHDPWSGEVVDGFLWGRGALDMKSQVAAEAVAAAALARQGWRPRKGHLKLVFMADEETGGELGAQWLTGTHPEKVRCEMLINEGGGEPFEYGDRRRYGVCCAEKGVFRFAITVRGASGHASLPKTGDNALLKLGPVLQRLGESQQSFEETEVPAALLRALGEDPADPGAALERIAAAEPRLVTFLEPMLGVTLTPTMASASEKINVIPSRAELRVDCRVPPGLAEDAARRRSDEALGEQRAHG